MVGIPATKRGHNAISMPKPPPDGDPAGQISAALSMTGRQARVYWRVHIAFLRIRRKRPPCMTALAPARKAQAGGGTPQKAKKI
ncbi:hypothetical protein CYR40_16365 [Chimaeribacter arupi]|uniref:Uncharacterized protein n=1 Tax=Chimaeribacter arupi TaxID=2060066 RepID=A0A2N5EJA3_9GAMM|nr:hypothetical protein CYR23_02925 [Chimaeribacter arupi]PLR43918.1 hypothetical protein CYR40_16365 [Chimaeribacter arupi]PLR45656.1 hypothetical protein CYR34_17120 [Chimaeribacter arupi]PLR52337.1 hypothetical protein CYR52_07190 [Chimaeribacter arupi]